MNTWQIDLGKAHRGLIDNTHWAGIYHFLSENFIFLFGFQKFLFCFLGLEMINFLASLYLFSNSSDRLLSSHEFLLWLPTKWDLKIVMKYPSIFSKVFLQNETWKSTLRNSATIDGLDIIMESTNWAFWLFSKKV